MAASKHFNIELIRIKSVCRLTGFCSSPHLMEQVDQKYISHCLPISLGLLEFFSLTETVLSRDCPLVETVSLDSQSIHDLSLPY